VSRIKQKLEFLVWKQDNQHSIKCNSRAKRFQFPPFIPSSSSS